MQSIVLFSKNNKFQLSNAKRTVKAYEAVKNVKPVYGNYKVIEKITEFGLTDIILFVMVVQIALILVSQEIKKRNVRFIKILQERTVEFNCEQDGGIIHNVSNCNNNCIWN